jgi:hypothetical protein
MRSLVLALYAEGPTDERFLSIIIQRTAEGLLLRLGQTVVDVLTPIILRPKFTHTLTSRAESILDVAQQAYGYHALIIHTDADHSTSEWAMNERIRPGIDLVQLRQNGVCHHLVPIIPVRMTEAWMLTDIRALQTVIGTDLSATALGIPEHPSLVDKLLEPKQILNQAIQNSGRRRRIHLGTLYEPLARQIDLGHLQIVAAYQDFTNDLTNTLKILHFIA